MRQVLILLERTQVELRPCRSARAIVVEAALSFVGLGVQPPLTSWGAMILSGANAARAGLLHLILAPAAALSLTVLAYNFLGDGLRDALDPHLGDRASRTVRR